MEYFQVTFFIVYVQIFSMECLRLHSCELCERIKYCKDDKDLHYKQLIKFRNNSIKKILLITGTRPGIGTSIYALEHAYELSLQGFKVGLVETSTLFSSTQFYLDLDNTDLLRLLINGVSPIKVKDNLFLISPSFFMSSNSDEVLLWQEEAIYNFVESMMINTNWGELDYLIIDLDANHVFMINSLQNLFPNKLDNAVVITDKFIKSSKQAKLFFSFINNNIKILYVLSSYNSIHTNLEISNFKCSELPFIQNIGELFNNKNNFINSLNEYYSDLTREVISYCKQIY